MTTPRWVATRTQPIAIEDLVAYLVAALDAPLEGSRVVEIGGPDQVGYGELMREYARQRGLRRVFLPVPVLTPKLSSLWLGLTTPVYARVGRKLIEGVRNPTVVTNRDAIEIGSMHWSGSMWWPDLPVKEISKTRMWAIIGPGLVAMMPPSANWLMPRVLVISTHWIASM